MSTNESTKPLTKTQLITALAEKQGLPKATVSAFLETLSETVTAQLAKTGPGVFILPGVIKLKTVDKPATEAREGINPFTKAKITIAAKPASRKVRASVVKALTNAIS